MTFVVRDVTNLRLRQQRINESRFGPLRGIPLLEVVAPVLFQSEHGA